MREEQSSHSQSGFRFTRSNNRANEAAASTNDAPQKQPSDSASMTLTEWEDQFRNKAIDVLAPWGEKGPAPIGSWRRDILGAGFDSRTIPLDPDEEGELCATLTRYVPHDDPKYRESHYTTPHFIALFIHGRNDYFFHDDVARHFSTEGAAFYALDLHKYGRSLRPHHTIGMTGDLREYDEEIRVALDIIRKETGNLPLVFIAHSTGGLIASLWVYRHPGTTAGLILNSPWLDMNTPQSVRSAVQPLLSVIASYNPLWTFPGNTSNKGIYGRSLLEGWRGSGFPLPDRLRGYEEDPAVTGWDYAPEWKRPLSYPVYAQWIEAIMEGQTLLRHRKAHIDCPILGLLSHKSYPDSTNWSEQVFTTDAILETDILAQRLASLGPLTTIARFKGRHDLFLSDPDVRKKIWTVIHKWCQALFFDAY